MWSVQQESLGYYSKQGDLVLHGQWNMSMPVATVANKYLAIGSFNVIFPFR